MIGQVLVRAVGVLLLILAVGSAPLHQAGAMVNCPFASSLSQLQYQADFGTPIQGDDSGDDDDSNRSMRKMVNCLAACGLLAACEPQGKLLVRDGLHPERALVAVAHGRVTAPEILPPIAL